MNFGSASSRVLFAVEKHLPQLTQSSRWQELDHRDREDAYLALGTATVYVTSAPAGALTSQMIRSYCAALEELAAARDFDIDDVIVTSALHLIDPLTSIGGRIVAGLGPEARRLLPWM